MRMQLLMVFVLLVAMLRFRLGARAFYIVFPRVLRTYRAEGKQPLQVFAAAFRAGGNVALTDKLFEGVATFSTGVFVNWHRRVSISRDWPWRKLHFVPKSIPDYWQESVPRTILA